MYRVLDCDCAPRLRWARLDAPARMPRPCTCFAATACACASVLLSLQAVSALSARACRPSRKMQNQECSPPDSNQGPHASQARVIPLDQSLEASKDLDKPRIQQRKKRRFKSSSTASASAHFHVLTHRKSERKSETKSEEKTTHTVQIHVLKSERKNERTSEIQGLLLARLPSKSSSICRLSSPNCVIFQHFFPFCAHFFVHVFVHFFVP